MDKKLICVIFIMTAVPFSIACVPGTSLAQDANAPQAQTVPEAKDGARGPSGKDAPEAKPEAKPAPQEAPLKSYVVVRHDTLWAISGRLLKDPFKWPALWKANPGIKNPDLIYPGDKITISPLEEVAIPPAAAAGKKEAGAEGKEIEAKKPEQVVTLEPEKPVVLEPEAEPFALTALKQTQGARTAPGSSPSIVDAAFERMGFVSAGDSEASGVILGSREKRTYLTAGDDVFISFRDPGSVKAGDRFTIYANGKAVVHPVTKEKIGSMVDIIGAVVVTKAGGVFEGRVEKAYREMEAGAKLRPYREPVREVEITQTRADVTAYIIASLEGKEFFSRGDIVYIDRGAVDGLEKGNTLKIYKKGAVTINPLNREKVYLPQIELGELVVLDPMERTSACMITQAQKSINFGDIVSTR